MKKILSVALSAISAVCIYGADSQAGSGETGSYRLVWQDLFDAPSLDTLSWNIEVTPRPANQELQYYTDRPCNVSVGDDGRGNSCLILTAIREDYGGRHFTSGRVNTREKVNFKYGKIEASVRMPSTADGLWPAFWMMGDDIASVGWPRCGEIDIFEMGHHEGISTGTQGSYMNGAAHWGYYIDRQYPTTATFSNAPYSVHDGEYHLFTCIWTPEKVSMYLDLDKYPDAKPYYELAIDHNGTPDDRSADLYFRKPFHVLFNLAVGGHFPGITDPEKITALNSGNDNRANYYINYVKVYQRDEDEGSFQSPK